MTVQELNQELIIRLKGDELGFFGPGFETVNSSVFVDGTVYPAILLVPNVQSKEAISRWRDRLIDHHFLFTEHNLGTDKRFCFKIFDI